MEHHALLEIQLHENKKSRSLPKAHEFYPWRPHMIWNFSTLMWIQHFCIEKQPTGFVELGQEHMVCKLRKCSKQAARQWHLKIQECMTKSGTTVALLTNAYL
jgi:hypothetical protein